MTKTGSGGRPWIAFDSPKPLPVADPYDYWSIEPLGMSDRCRWWLRQIDRGWRPNRAWRGEGFESSAFLYGVWIWEYLNVIVPALWRASKESSHLG